VFTANAVPETFAGNWTVGAVDGSGQYLFAVDGTGLKLHFYSITPVGTGGTDGALTEVGTGASIPGAMQPAGVVVDPTDRFVLVTDAKANTITPFTFNPTTPSLTAGTAVTVPSGAGQVTIDPTGTYVFVALAGATSGSPESGVAVYSVAVSKGVLTLTAVTGSPFTTGTGASGTTGVGIINSVK
jgi:DNA-binding beta-propeller fold protein YncE